ncbi:Protein of unknown function [Desulfonatronum thiosulfatophilum]|uniref:Lcl C-terminal domain-containing protein n=1 Tax=Desulfonatronum thiosulfatophilum TaxID=617002 RepID=A0A1G6CLX7_9BACT|nr:DUF1566 domain-containing protein [Desulfonatronum thiosulfatophilum]SDB33869.1 Protein of unknown function [Desulfonatronum thiosulfatophilum]
MKKLFAVAAMAVMLCIAGLVMSGEAQAQRFVDYGDGTVMDTATNLMWTNNANPFGRLNWDDAMSRCSSFSISGIGGWRLPSKDELLILYHAMSGGHPFTGFQSSSYWSSSTYEDGHDFAWFVNMSHGSVDHYRKIDITYVWPVRAGQ